MASLASGDTRSAFPSSSGGAFPRRFLLFWHRPHLEAGVHPLRPGPQVRPSQLGKVGAGLHQTPPLQGLTPGLSSPLSPPPGLTAFHLPPQFPPSPQGAHRVGPYPLDPKPGWLLPRPRRPALATVAKGHGSTAEPRTFLRPHEYLSIQMMPGPRCQGGQALQPRHRKNDPESE